MAQILLGGSIGVQGTQAVLGNVTINYTTDVNLTLTAVQWANLFLEITSSVSLSPGRQLIAPLNQGQEFIVQNNTTGGQSITVIGSSGTGVTIADGYTAAVVCDGTNYIQIGGISTTSGSFTAGGDLSGSATSQEVIGLLAQSLPSLSDGYLNWNGSTWQFSTIGSGFTAGGDLSGSSTDQTVIGLYNNPLASTTPSQSDVPIWDTSLSHYSIRQLTADDIAAGFTINSFAGGSTVEIGATVTNPAFTASYSHTPNSAQITNTDGIDSPLVLSSPYTSGTVVGSFNHNVQATVTFTLTAIYTSTKTATQAINFYPRMFAGVGGAGATSATASGTSAVLNSSLGTLTNIGLLSSLAVGTLITETPSAQKIYVLATGGSHTFVDNSNNLPFSFLTPTGITFSNINSQNVSMYIYESTNTLTGSFTLKVTA
jgi:hypothetical protein